MSFRKRTFGGCLAHTNPVTTVKEVSAELLREDGSKVIQVTYDIVDACDPENFEPLPTVEEYSLSNLMSVPGALEQVPISGLIDDLHSDIDNANKVLDALKLAKESQENNN